MTNTSATGSKLHIPPIIISQQLNRSHTKKKKKELNSYIVIEK